MAIAQLEQEKQRPIYSSEVYKAVLESPIPGLPAMASNFSIGDLFKMDLVMADFENYRYSLDPARQRHPETNPESEYELCSDRMARKYPGYTLNEHLRFVAGPTIQKIKLTDLKEMLLCKDLECYEQIQQTLTENNKCSFLDESCNLVEIGESVAFQSYPRSGNTFLRMYLEKISGIWTGSDMSLKMTFDESMSLGMLGQNITCDDNRVWITKSHYPN